MEKKDFFAPLSLGLGATRRAAVLLLVMMLTTVTARAAEYEISTLEELREFMEAVHVEDFAGDVIRLTADIDCDGGRFNNGDPEYPSTFRGTFDGQGHKIYNFVHGPTGSGQEGYGTAMFDFAETGATIQNLTLEGSLPGDKYCGAYAAAFVLAVESPLGLLLDNCHFNGSVTNVYHSAALVGSASSGTGSEEVPSIFLINCSANANITTTGNSNNIAGGLVAKGTGVKAYDCSFKGKVTSLGTVGGLIGEAINCELENCFSAATISTGGAYYGAILGCNIGGTLLRNTYIYTTCYGVGTGNSTSADVTENYGAVNASPDHFVQDGDGSYTIKSALGWNVFCGLLATEAKGYFTGKTVKLDADIEVSRMAGDSGHPFTGTFDGNQKTLTVSYGSADSRITEQYAAPFRYVEGCTIQNLRVSGSIYTAAKYAGGLIADQYGAVTIRNCRSSVTINSSVDGDGTHGGLVAVNNSSTDSNLTIEGCLFDGKLLTTNGTIKCGGFIGWRDGTANIYNSLFAPAEVTVSNEGSATFARNKVDCYNSYYTQTLGELQGIAAHTIAAGEGVTLGHAGEAIEYNVSGITAYKASDAHGDNDPFIDGLVYNEVLYAGDGDEVSLTLANTTPAGYQYGYSASAGTLSGTENPYTLTMPDEDVTITAALSVIDWATESDGDADHPYMIYNKDQLDLLAHRVNGTHGETRQKDGYSGKYFKLANDINYPHSSDWNNFTSDENNFEAIGGNFDSYNSHFRGHFDGNNKTISGIRIYKDGNGYADNYQGIFGRTANGADIHDLTLADARITGHDDIGGIVGINGYNSTVNRCHVAANVAICAVQPNVSSHGGIVGYSDRGTIENCISAATLTVVDADNSNYYGGIVGTNRQYSTLHDNLVIGATVPAVTANNYGAITGYNDRSTLQRNYYTACKVADVENATGVGSCNADVTDGAVPGYLLTLGEGITSTALSITIPEHKELNSSGQLVTVAAVTYNVAAAGTTVWFNSGETEGYSTSYIVDGSPVSGNSITMPAAPVTVTSNDNEHIDLWGIDGGADGSSEHPYIITTTAGWFHLAGNVAAGKSYSDKYFQLGAGISISTMVGTSDHPFSGHFNGNGNTLDIDIISVGEYTAPFRYVSGATITGLHTTGTVTTSHKCATGLVGRHDGDVTISDCRSSVTIASCIYDDGTHGGFAATGSGTVTIEGCLFDGVICCNIAKLTNKCGGFVGWRSGTVNISNSLYAPAAVPEGKYAIKTDGCATFARNGATITNCYYTQTLGDAQGKACHSITAGENVTIDGLGAGTEYSVSGITAYPTGIKYNDVYYAGSGDQVSLTLSHGDKAGYAFNEYTASAGTLSGTENPYTLTMPDGDVTITVGLSVIDWATEGNSGDDADHPYMIYNKDQLLLLAHRVNGTSGETANDYEGKYFKLGADIAFTHDAEEGDDYAENYEAIGGYIGGTIRYFLGDFNGDNHTVSGIRINKTGTDYTDAYQALFGCIGSGAEIHDVHVTDARITGYDSVGGIVGYTYGDIIRCSVTDSYITATYWNYGTICGRATDTENLRNNYYHGCTVNGTAATSGKGCSGSDITANNGALPAYRLALGANITTPPETFVGQTEWLDTPPVDARLAPENGFTLAGNHYFASGYEFTPGSTLASGAAQGYTPRATLGDELLDLYTPTGDTDPLAGTAIARLSITADCDGKTLASTEAIYSTRQPVNVAFIDADGKEKIASAIALDGTENSLGQNEQDTWYFVGNDFSHSGTINCYGDVHIILADGKTMTVTNTGTGNEDFAIYGDSGPLHIYGQSQGTGALTATANSSVAIKLDDYITINGGTVNATSTGDVGIYGIDGVTINGGTVNANGIYSDGDVTINGGKVTATATSNSGICSNNGTIILGLSNATDYITAESYNGAVKVADGQTLTDGTNTYSGTLTDDQKKAIEEKTLQPCLALADNADNTAAIRDHKGQAFAVALQGRTLYKDGDWNTLCLPFDVSTTSGPLAGDDVVAMTLNTSESNLTGSTLTLNFEAATTIPAGTPFIIKWATKENPATNLVSPVFTGVTIDNTMNNADFTGGTFKGTYSPIVWNTENKSILFVGTNNTLYWPTAGGHVNACRAYFDLGSASAREFVMNFDGENEVTSLPQPLQKEGSQADAWYTLDGRKLNGKPTTKGLYIHNGKKVIIK